MIISNIHIQIFKGFYKMFILIFIKIDILKDLIIYVQYLDQVHYNPIIHSLSPYKFNYELIFHLPDTIIDSMSPYPIIRSHKNRSFPCMARTGFKT